MPASEITFHVSHARSHEKRKTESIGDSLSALLTMKVNARSKGNLQRGVEIDGNGGT